MGERGFLSRLWAKAAYLLFRAVGLIIQFIGLAGIPDDSATWQRWINNVINDPTVAAASERVIAISEWLAEAATYLNSPWARGALIVLGIIVLIWPWRRFWRLRNRLIFWGRRIVSEEVWIGRQVAYDIIRKSRWASSREPRQTIMDSFASATTIGGDPNTSFKQRSRRFNHFCELALDGFEEKNSQYARVSDGNKEYREDKVREFIAEAYNEELHREFGRLPSTELDP